MVNQDFNLVYLTIQLNRVDILVQREVRRWELAGQDINNPLRGVQIKQAEIVELLNQPVGYNWGQTVPLSADEEQAYASLLESLSQQANAIIEHASQQQQCPRLRQLTTTLNLSQFEVDAFLICLAPAFDLRYEKLYAFLQDDITRKAPTVDLILNLLAPPGAERLTYLTHFSEAAPLFTHRLLETLPEANATPPLLRRAFKVDETIVAWILGEYHPSPEFSIYFKLSAAQPSRTDNLLIKPHETDFNSLIQALQQPPLIEAQPPLIAFHGPDYGSQHAAARQIAAMLQRPILQVDLAKIVKAELNLTQAFRLALRDGLLTEAIVYLTGWDTCLVDGAPLIELLETVCDYPKTLIVSSEKPWQPRNFDRQRAIVWLGFERPNYLQRQALWHQFISGEQGEESSSQADLENLAGQFTLTSSQIRDAVAAARDAVQKRLQDQTDGFSCSEQDRPTLQPTREELFAAARAYSNPRLVDLARKITPRYSWNDLILPPDLIAILRELVAMVKGRPKVLEAWGIGKKLTASAGVTVLFAGPPGTGKTMAAEVIAGELGLDLFKINLSSVVSKYIGETEKNLERIFQEAQNSNAILFFDEADSIFGKRSEVKDARDRYANLEVSYLLQRMEAYDGVTILATNLRSNLDEAFTRRLQFALDVPFPRENYRLQIWQTLFPPDLPHEADLNFEFLARKFKLAGGSIRNIIVGAAYLAAADNGMVSMAHLLHSTRRELQKMGRLVSEADFRPDRDNQKKGPPSGMSKQAMKTTRFEGKKS